LNFHFLLKVPKYEGKMKEKETMSKIAEPAPWTTEGEEKRTAVRAMFEEIAPNYDKVNALMSFNRHHHWRQAAVRSLHLRPGARVLDVCCGTGDFFPPLRAAIGPEGEITGIDFCQPMLDRANAKDANAKLDLGDACNLPYPDAQFDAVTVGWGIRNVPDIDLAHKEAFRVLISGGRFVSVDMAEPESRLLRAASRFATSKLLPLLGSLFGNKRAYQYLPESTKRFKTRVELKQSMEEAGFTDVQTRDFMFGNVCMHTGRKP